MERELTRSWRRGPRAYVAGALLLIVALLVGLPTSAAQAQSTSAWGRTFGGTATDWGFGVAVDDVGNTYISGAFRNTADFEPGPGVTNLTSNGNADVYVAKLDPAGELIWARGLGGPANDLSYGLAIDDNGNVHITGLFRRTADFDPGPGVANLTSNGDYDGFVAKLDTDGDLVWARSFGGRSHDQGWGIAVDASGNSYTTGRFRRTVDFDPGPGVANLTSSGRDDSFVAKYDAAGQLVWARAFGGSNVEQGRGVAVDPAGNVYTNGTFRGTTDFDPGLGVANLTSNGGFDAYITKLDPNGDLIWAEKFGGTSNDEAYGVGVDGAGDVYMAGRFRGGASLGSVVGQPDITGRGYDVFVTKLTDGGGLVWARNLGGRGDDEGFGMTVDAAGNTYTTGSFQGRADFDPGSGVANLRSDGGHDAFVAKLDAAGNHVWARHLGGPGKDEGRGIATDTTGSTYTTGGFNRTLDVDPGPGVLTHTSVGRGDAFVVKLNPNGNVVEPNEPPEITPPGPVVVTENVTRVVDVDATDDTDAEGAGLTWSITGGEDQAAFTIKPHNGVLRFDPPVDYENPTDADSDNDYHVEVTVTDSGGLTDSELLLVIVTDDRELRWPIQAGGTGADEGLDVVVDSARNVIASGVFDGTTDFDPGPGVVDLTSNGGRDGFLAKYSWDGELHWARGFGGSGSLDLAYGAAVDGGGNSFAVGTFEGTADLDPGSGTLNITSNGDTDVFVAKLDPAGDLAWARAFGGPQQDLGWSVAADSQGNVVVSGRFLGTVDFDPGAGVFELTSSGNTDVFMVKLDADGDLVWARSFGGFAADGREVVVDAAGNIVITGFFQGSGDFDPGPGMVDLVSNGSIDAFVATYDPAGELLWARNLGGPGNDAGWGVTIDEHGNTYATGVFEVTADFDPGSGVNNLTSNGETDAYIVKLDSAGDLVWASAVGGPGEEIAREVAVDESGRAHVTGRFQDTADFDPGAGVSNLTSNGGADVFVARLSPSGGLEWARGFGAQAGDQGHGIALDARGNSFTTGLFGGVVDFDPEAAVNNLISNGSNDMFITRLDTSGRLVEPERWSSLPINAGGPAPDGGLDIATDGVGNLVASGVFTGTADFDPSPGVVNLTSNGGRDAFLARYTWEGELLWARGFGGSGSLDLAYGAAVDAVGNSFAVGTFDGIADLDPGPGSLNVTSNGSTDVFVAKLDPAGDLVWARAFGGAQQELGRSVAADSSGNVIVTGRFLGTVDFDPGAGVFELTSSGNTDVFMVKLDADGDLVWAHSFGGFAAEGRDVTVDGADNIVITGYFQGGGDFDPGPGVVNLTSNGSIDAFVATYDPAGDLIWARNVGGTGNDAAWAVTVDGAGNTYATGVFEATGDFDPGSGVTNLTSSGGSDGFIVKLDPTGDFVWAGAVGGAGEEISHGIAVDGSGSAQITGRFQGTADFDPGAGVSNLTSNGGTDVFVARFDTAGDLAWAHGFGAGAADQGHGIAIDPTGNSYTTGNFGGTVDFEPRA